MGEIPFEELHFNWSVLCRLDIREFKVSRRRSLAKMNFRFSQVILSGSTFSLSLAVPDFPFSLAWEFGLQFEVRKRE